MLSLGFLLLSLAIGPGSPTPAADARSDTLRRFGLDPSSSLDSRVTTTPPSVLKMFEELGGPAPTPHALTPEEKQQLAEALAALSPLQRRVLGQRLRSLSFLDGMPNTALTSTVNPDGAYKLFDVTIRAGVFRQTVSEWLTEKERGCYDDSASPLSISIEAGSKPAIVYALLHEATHVVDSSLHVTPAPAAGGTTPAAPEPTAFTRGVWVDAATPESRYRDPLLVSACFRPGGKVRPIADAPAVYGALARTPFPSLYGSRNWYDDLAEFVALYELTQTLGQPYRIVIRRGAETIFTDEPMKSSLVLGRAASVKELLTTPSPRGQGGTSPAPPPSPEDVAPRTIPP
ncbi:MAG TPA: hypothetical protein VMN82_10055 [Thermoanaerobaculia bacterium]|nr:hypothetical protein [Thermoanaerobaculia bacterium]